MQVKRLSIQLIAALLCAILLAYLGSHYIHFNQLSILSIGMVGATAAILFLVLYKKAFWNDHQLQAILVSILIITAFIGPGLISVSFGPISLFPFRIMLGVTILYMIIRVIKKRERISILENPAWPAYTFFVFWLLYGLLALSWVHSLGEGIKDLIFLISGLLIIFLIGSSFNKEKHFVEFYTIWVMMGLALIFLGLINHFLQIHLPISRISTVAAYQKHIPTAVFVNENDYASFLSITVFFLLSLVFYMKSNILKLVGIAGTGASLYLILITDSRANLLALALGFAVWFLFMMNGRQKISSIIIFVPLSIGVLVTQYEKIEPYLTMIFVQIQSLFVREGAQLTSIDIRENLLRNIKYFIESTFGLGVGPGNAEVYMRDFFIYPTDGDVNTHNWWAEIFVEYGALVFVGYILMFIYLLWNIYKIRKRASDQVTILISSALFASLCVFTLASISPNSLMTLNYNWLLIGFALGYINYKKRSELEVSGGIMK